MPLPAILAALGSGTGGVAGLAGAAGMDKLSKGLTKVSSVASHAGRDLGAVTNSLGQLSGVATYVPSQILKAKAAITGMADMLVSSLAAPAETINELGTSLARFVKFAQPASVKQFEIRVENMFATLGNMVEPILKSLTTAAIEMNDAMGKLKPAFQPIFNETSNMVKMLSKELVPAAKELAPVLQFAAMHMRSFTMMMKFAIDQMKTAMMVVNKIPGAKNFFKGGFDPGGKGDVAVRQVSTTTSAESISQKAIEQALMQGINKPEDPVVAALDPITKLLMDIFQYLQAQMPDLPKVADVQKFINDLPGKLAGGAGSAVSGAVSNSPAGALLGMFRSAMTR